VARGTVFHVQQLDRLLEQAIKHVGFSVVEIMSNCHIQFGRRNKMGDPVTMLQGYRDRAVPVVKAGTMTPAELAGKFTIGVLAAIDKPNYLEEYEKIRGRAAAKP
jgi:2-oxoglutarate ferredoxin oxidoreductase subunit beta